MNKNIVSLWDFAISQYFIRYIIIGGGLFLIDLAIFMSLKKLGISTPVSQIISRTIGAVIGFCAHKLFTFRNKTNNTGIVVTQGTEYTGVTVMNIFISPIIVSGFEMILPGNLIVIKMLSEIIMVTETYFFLRIIFKQRF